MIPLTPNLKYSDPHSRMYEDKHIFKRSNSQNEFDFFNNSSGTNLLEINDHQLNTPYINIEEEAIF